MAIAIFCAQTIAMKENTLIDELLNSLRYKSEGADIDFKRTQYRFNAGNESDKAEMLKDILAIANAWRDGPGYILLGFKDQRPHPAEVVGISETIDDAKIQQFVHGKVKPKLTFSYEEHLYEGKTIGVIGIPKQRRAFYLAHAYGKLKSNVVYVRRGSTTDEAEPPEIASMQLADAGHGDMRVDLSLCMPDSGLLPDTIARSFLRFTEKFPDYQSPRLSRGPLGIDLPNLSGERDNSNFWTEYAKYLSMKERLILIRFVLHNRSAAQLSNAKLEVSTEPLSGQGIEVVVGNDLPEEPKKKWDPISGFRNVPDMMSRNKSLFVIDRESALPVCHVRFGSLLPGEEKRSSDMLAVLPDAPGKFRLRFRILGSELATPHESDRVIESTGTVKQLNFEDFLAFVGLRNCPQ